MMRKLSFVFFCEVIWFGIPVQAQEVSSSAATALETIDYQHAAEFLYPSHAISSFESIPDRPLVLNPDQLNVYSGLSTDLSDGYAGKGWSVPMGAGYGLLPNLELGFDTAWLLSPWESSALISKFSFYGRYLIVERVLAAQVTLWVPTFVYDQFGFELLAPGRLRLGPVELFGQFLFNYFDGSYGDNLKLSLAVSGLIGVWKGMFVGIDSGFSYQRFGMDTAAEDYDLTIPLAFGVGYRISSNTFIKAMFSFPDLAGKDPVTDDYSGHRRRALLLTFVQTFDLSPYCIKPEEQCPTCPSSLQETQLTTTPVLPNPETDSNQDQ